MLMISTEESGIRNRESGLSQGRGLRAKDSGQRTQGIRCPRLDARSCSDRSSDRTSPLIMRPTS